MRIYPNRITTAKKPRQNSSIKNAETCMLPASIVMSPGAQYAETSHE